MSYYLINRFDFPVFGCYGQYFMLLLNLYLSIITEVYMSSTIILTSIVTAGIVAIVLIDTLKSYFIKKEQIRADALVRAEEVKAKNQLEIEKLFKNDHHHINENFEDTTFRKNNQKNNN